MPVLYPGKGCHDRGAVLFPRCKPSSDGTGFEDSGPSADIDRAEEICQVVGERGQTESSTVGAPDLAKDTFRGRRGGYTTQVSALGGSHPRWESKAVPCNRANPIGPDDDIEIMLRAPRQTDRSSTRSHRHTDDDVIKEDLGPRSFRRRCQLRLEIGAKQNRHPGKWCSRAREVETEEALAPDRLDHDVTELADARPERVEDADGGKGPKAVALDRYSAADATMWVGSLEDRYVEAQPACGCGCHESGRSCTDDSDRAHHGRPPPRVCSGAAKASRQGKIERAPESPR